MSKSVESQRGVPVAEDELLQLLDGFVCGQFIRYQQLVTSLGTTMASQVGSLPYFLDGVPAVPSAGIFLVVVFRSLLSFRFSRAWRGTALHEKDTENSSNCFSCLFRVRVFNFLPHRGICQFPIGRYTSPVFVCPSTLNTMPV